MSSNQPRIFLRKIVFAALVITALAGLLRMQAVQRLPVDFDELVYLPVAFQYEQLMEAGKWSEIVDYKENLEHPPLNKLLFALNLLARHPQEPGWDALEVGKPIPVSDQPAFYGPRTISAIGGTLQVLITALVNPFAGILLALDTYHIKYSAQVYLEGVPGLMAVLAVFLFELGVRREVSDSRIRWKWLALSAVTLGLSAAGKYLYGIAGFVLLAFMIYRTRSMRTVLLYCALSLVVFFLADPFLWVNPLQRLQESILFHWNYSHGEHVASSGLPWFAPVLHLLRASPTEWHPGVFYTGIADLIILPFSLIGIRWAWREQPVYIAWAGFGIFFLLLWPTKWPQYILLVLPPLTVCAGIAIQHLAGFLLHKIRRQEAGIA